MRDISIKNGAIEIITKKTLIPQTKGKTFCMSKEIGEKFNISRCFACDWPFQISGETVNPILFKHHKVEYLCDDCAEKI